MPNNQTAFYTGTGMGTAGGIGGDANAGELVSGAAQTAHYGISVGLEQLSTLWQLFTSLLSILV